MIELDHADLNISKQAALLYLNRTSLYYKPKICNDTELANKIHEIYLQSKCIYGYRKISASLPNQVWATDITYIALPSGFVYLVAIIDIYSRYIIGHKVSVSLDAEFCQQCLNDSLKIGLKPQIFNSDQGSQFTSIEFIKILQINHIQISMDGKGRCFDNIFVERLWRTIKQEDAYYQRYETVTEAKKSLGEFITWYNYERLHQALDYKTPHQVYFGQATLV